MVLNRRSFMKSALLGLSRFGRFEFSRPAARPFLLSATVDFPDDVNFGIWDQKSLHQMMGLLRSIGVQRLYWLYYGDPDPSSEWAETIFPVMKYGAATISQIGEPLKAAVPIAHRHGLEIYGVLKPYNTGFSGTYPEGSAQSSLNTVRRIGGTLQQVIPFIERHPQLRIQRRPTRLPADLHTAPIRKIRLAKKDASPTRLTRESLQIWTSPDNYRYQQRNLTFTVAERVERAPQDVTDYYGDVITRKDSPVRILELQNLSLHDRFILVTTRFSDGPGDFRNTACAMISAYGSGDAPLPIVVASPNAIWDSPRDFRSSGLDFDSGCGPFQMTLDIDNADPRFNQLVPDGGCIAFARGKNDYLPCAPCEAYPEVRDLWLGWVDRILATGVDGIDLRISTHSTLTDEPFEYGFNQPILETYRKRYGSAGADEIEADKLAHLRGEYYTAFVQETSRRARKAGKKCQAHLHAEAFREKPCHGQLMGFPAHLYFDWPGWLRQGLLDGVTLRTSWFEAMEDLDGSRRNHEKLTDALADPVAQEMLQACHELGLPVYLNRYVKRSSGMPEYTSDLERIFKDGRFSGFDIYEFAYLARASANNSTLSPVGDRLEAIRRMVKQHEFGNE